MLSVCAVILCSLINIYCFNERRKQFYRQKDLSMTYRDIIFDEDIEALKSNGVFLDSNLYFHDEKYDSISIGSLVKARKN